MALAIVGTPVRGDFGTFESNTKTISVTVPSGAELMVLKVMGGNGGGNWGGLTGVTVNGSSTGVTEQVTSQADMSIKSRIWTLVSPTVGTYDVVWTFSGSSENGGAYFAECWGGGVDTGSPVADTDSFGQSLAVSPMTNSLTVPAGGAVTGVHGLVLPANTVVLEAGQTALGTLDSRGSSYKVADGTVTFGFNWTGTPQAAQAVIAIRAAAPAPTLDGGFTLADLVFSGTFATGALSQLAGGFTLDDFLNGGVMGLAPGIVATEPFKNWSGTLLPGVTVPNVVFLKLDRTTAVALVNQTTAGDGVMTVANAALVTGTFYIMVSFDATGASIGAELVQAA